MYNLNILMEICPIIELHGDTYLVPHFVEFYESSNVYTRIKRKRVFAMRICMTG